MPFNVNNFRQNIAQNGYLRTNSFRVIVTPPSMLRNSAVNTFGTPTPTKNIADELSFRVEQIRTPGISLETADIHKYSVGPSRKVPVNAKFQEVELTILSDGYGNIWQFWHNWINNIFNFTSTTNLSSGRFQVNELANYSAEYMSNYSTNMGIIVYDSFGNGIMRIDFFEAYPIAFREVQLNWGEQRGLIKLGVTMTFSEYVITGSSVESQMQRFEGRMRQPISTRSNTILT